MMLSNSLLSLFPVRRFSMMASGAPSSSAMSRARFEPPMSTATTTGLSMPIALNRSTMMGIAVSSSTGMLKKPCICPACRSIVSTRSAPAVVSRSAMSRAVMGTRGWSFLSVRP